MGLLWTKGESAGKCLRHRYVLFHQVVHTVCACNVGGIMTCGWCIASLSGHCRHWDGERKGTSHNDGWQVLFCVTHGEELLDGEGPNPKWKVLEKTRRGRHLHLGRCFSAGGSHSVLTDDDGNKLFAFVVLGGQERHVFWAPTEEERDAWVADVQAVVGEQLDQSLSQTRGISSDRTVHDHAFWDTSLWELRSFYQSQLEDEKEGCRSSTGLMCSGTRVAYILPGSSADRKVRCLQTNEEIRLGIGDEILEVNNELVTPDTCAAMLRGDDVVGSMVRIKIRKHTHSSAGPASPIVKAIDPHTSPLLSPAQSPSSALNRSSIHSFSPFRWDGKSQKVAGEYEVDLVSGPVLNLMRYDDLHRVVNKLEDTLTSHGGFEELLLHTDGMIKALDTYASYASSHIDGLERVFHGEMALAASREGMWLRQAFRTRSVCISFSIELNCLCSHL